MRDITNTTVEVDLLVTSSRRMGTIIMATATTRTKGLERTVLISTTGSLLASLPGSREISELIMVSKNFQQLEGN